jgi:hypothetical protein
VAKLLYFWAEQVCSYENTNSIRDCPYRTSRESILELIQISSLKKVSLV